LSSPPPFPPPSRSAFSTASPVSIDWASVRAKMMTDETRAEADRAREAFQKRLSAADVGAPQEIDWARYTAALPELDVAAIKRDYEATVAATPAVAYDESADRAAHDVKEASWAGFASYCASRLKELDTLKATQAQHKLHPFYRRRQLYSRCVRRSRPTAQEGGLLRPRRDETSDEGERAPASPQVVVSSSSWWCGVGGQAHPLLELTPSPLFPPSPRPRSFPGLYENLHDKIRGQWDTDAWTQYIAYKARATPFPWDANAGEVDEGKRKELMVQIATKAGVKPEDLGFKV
jgi:hypothetical protein